MCPKEASGGKKKQLNVYNMILHMDYLCLYNRMRSYEVFLKKKKARKNTFLISGSGKRNLNIQHKCFCHCLNFFI